MLSASLNDLRTLVSKIRYSRIQGMSDGPQCIMHVRHSSVTWVLHKVHPFTILVQEFTVRFPKLNTPGEVVEGVH